jgi:hypothetical protein
MMETVTDNAAMRWLLRANISVKAVLDACIPHSEHILAETLNKKERSGRMQVILEQSQRRLLGTAWAQHPGLLLDTQLSKNVSSHIVKQRGYLRSPD